MHKPNFNHKPKYRKKKTLPWKSSRNELQDATTSSNDNTWPWEMSFKQKCLQEENDTCAPPSQDPPTEISSWIFHSKEEFRVNTGQYLQQENNMEYYHCHTQPVQADLEFWLWSMWPFAQEHHQTQVTMYRNSHLKWRSHCCKPDLDTLTVAHLDCLNFDITMKLDIPRTWGIDRSTPASTNKVTAAA